MNQQKIETWSTRWLLDGVRSTSVKQADDNPDEGIEQTEHEE